MTAADRAAFLHSIVCSAFESLEDRMLMVAVGVEMGSTPIEVAEIVARRLCPNSELADALLSKHRQEVKNGAAELGGTANLASMAEAFLSRQGLDMSSLGDDDDDDDDGNEFMEDDSDEPEPGRLINYIADTYSVDIAEQIVPLIIRHSAVMAAGFNTIRVSFAEGDDAADQFVESVPIDSFTFHDILEYEDGARVLLEFDESCFECKIEGAIVTGANISLVSADPLGTLRLEAAFEPNLEALEGTASAALDICSDHINLIRMGETIDTFVNESLDPSTGKWNLMCLVGEYTQNGSPVIMRKGDLIETSSYPYGNLKVSDTEFTIGTMTIPLADLTAECDEHDQFTRFTLGDEHIYLTTAADNDRYVRELIELLDEMQEGAKRGTKIRVTLDNQAETCRFRDIQYPDGEHGYSPLSAIVFGPLAITAGSLGPNGCDFDNLRFEGILVTGKLLTIEKVPA